jgi:hypothetical protein
MHRASLVGSQEVKTGIETPSMGYKYSIAVEISHARKNVASNNFSNSAALLRF